MPKYTNKPTCKPNNHKVMAICECELERMIKEAVEKHKNACPIKADVVKLEHINNN
jgi:hypothetical protein